MSGSSYTNSVIHIQEIPSTPGLFMLTLNKEGIEVEAILDRLSLTIGALKCPIRIDLNDVEHRTDGDVIKINWLSSDYDFPFLADHIRLNELPDLVSLLRYYNLDFKFDFDDKLVIHVNDRQF